MVQAKAASGLNWSLYQWLGLEVGPREYEIVIGDVQYEYTNQILKQLYRKYVEFILWSFLA